VAAGAGNDALAVLFQERARTRAFGAILAQDVILLRRQLRAPFRIGFFDLEFLRGVCRRGPQPSEGGKAKQAGHRRKQDSAVYHDGLRAKRIRFLRSKIRGATPEVTPIRGENSHFVARYLYNNIRTLHRTLADVQTYYVPWALPA